MKSPEKVVKSLNDLEKPIMCNDKTNAKKVTNPDCTVDTAVSDSYFQGITRPGPHDVLCGRGGGTNNHCGNIKFRDMVNKHKLRYMAVGKVDKPKVASEVVDIWRSLEPPGRFLTRRDGGRRGPGSVKAEGNVWYDVGDKKAREKASQCLRERTPDVIPFVREMQAQQVLSSHQRKQVAAPTKTTSAPVPSATTIHTNQTMGYQNGNYSSQFRQAIALQQRAQQIAMAKVGVPPPRPPPLNATVAVQELLKQQWQQNVLNHLSPSLAHAILLSQQQQQQQKPQRVSTPPLSGLGQPTLFPSSPSYRPITRNEAEAAIALATASTARFQGVYKV